MLCVEVVIFKILSSCLVGLLHCVSTLPSERRAGSDVHNTGRVEEATSVHVDDVQRAR